MSVKRLREDLCRHQVRQNMPSQIASAVDVLIAMCDKHRPLGVNGKHGDLHTATCGCVDGNDGAATLLPQAPSRDSRP